MKMITNIYTIYDTKAKIYNKPFYIINDDVALRTALDLVNDQKSDVSKHPEDFIMYRIGQYEDTTAVFDLNEHADIICHFNQLSNEPEATSLRSLS